MNNILRAWPTCLSGETKVIISATGSEKMFFLWSSFSRVFFSGIIRHETDMVLANILSSLEHFYGLLGKNNGKRVTILCDDVLVQYTYAHSMLWVNQWNKLRGDDASDEMTSILTQLPAQWPMIMESLHDSSVGVPSLFSVLFVIVWGVRTYH